MGAAGAVVDDPDDAEGVEDEGGTRGLIGMLMTPRAALISLCIDLGSGYCGSSC